LKAFLIITVGAILHSPFILIIYMALCWWVYRFFPKHIQRDMPLGAMMIGLLMAMMALGFAAR